MLFDTDGYLLIESAGRIGTPSACHRAAGHTADGIPRHHPECYNRALIAFSDLQKPKAPLQVYGINTLSIDPGQYDPWIGQHTLTCMATPLWLRRPLYGLHCKQLCTADGGWRQRTSLSMHSGRHVGGDEPTWPLGESATVDGGAIWKEMTPVLANRLPAPNSPQLTRNPGGGSFPAGQDVYILVTYVNPQGESIASRPGILVNTAANDAVADSGASAGVSARMDSGAGCAYIPEASKSTRPMWRQAPKRRPRTAMGWSAIMRSAQPSR